MLSLLKSYFMLQCVFSMSEAVYDVIVIGGGTSGLAAVSKLAELGHKNILVLEASNQLGGRIRTTQTTGESLKKFLLKI